MNTQYNHCKQCSKQCKTTSKTGSCRATKLGEVIETNNSDDKNMSVNILIHYNIVLVTTSGILILQYKHIGKTSHINSVIFSKQSPTIYIMMGTGKIKREKGRRI